ncbi:MAG: hypothetical protein EKK48_13225 [Candidatus Melainabacteria bacterium]|nr:MAG: hypothetical protein EKK48_13225 [Candidatus Melainabacteria bacterium]
MKLVQKLMLGAMVLTGMSISGGQVLAMDSPFPYCKLLSLDPSALVAAPAVTGPQSAVDNSPRPPTIFELLKQTTDAKAIVNQILTQAAPLKPEELESMYDSVFQLISRDYIEPSRLTAWAATYKTKYKGKINSWGDLNSAIADMTSAVGDRWTYYKDPAAILAAQISVAEKSVYFGVALRLDTDGSYEVEAIQPGSTAQSVGIREGDGIISVNGTLLKGLSKQDAEKLLKGADNAQLRIVSLQDGVQVENTYTLHSPPDDANQAKADLVSNNIAYIKLPSFMDVQGFNKLIQILVGMNVKTPGGLQGIVLDLRYNGGGLVPMAKVLIRALVERGVILNERSRDEQGFVVDSKTSIPPLSDIEKAKLPAELLPTLDALKHLPMVVLINGSSASASEIVSGTLQEVRPDTTLVGERSFGKGVEMAVRPLPTCGELAITAAAYTTPSGKWLHNVGVVPDVVVHQPRGSSDDAQLAYAIKLLVDKTRTNGANVAVLPPGDTSILGTPAPRPLEVVKVVTWQDRVLQYRSEITRGAVGLLLLSILGGFVWLTRRSKS